MAGHTAVCGNLGMPIYCSVLAYGFSLPFLADSQVISSVDSVARDPLSIAISMDDLLWPRFGLAFLFWNPRGLSQCIRVAALHAKVKKVLVRSLRAKAGAAVEKRSSSPNGFVCAFARTDVVLNCGSELTC